MMRYVELARCFLGFCVYAFGYIAFLVALIAEGEVGIVVYTQTFNVSRIREFSFAVLGLFPAISSRPFLVQWEENHPLNNCIL